MMQEPITAAFWEHTATLFRSRRFFKSPPGLPLTLFITLPGTADTASRSSITAHRGAP